MRRFFVEKTGIRGNTVALSGGEAHHLHSVLRLDRGDRIELFDGSGTVYQVELEKLSGKTVTGKILSRRTETDTDPFPLTLGMGLLKGKKMDLVLQKATELGVRSLLPLLTRYSMQEKRSEQRRERRQRIMLEACKQCGRALPMHIAPPLPLTEIQTTRYRHLILCWEQETETLLMPDFFDVPGPVLLLIGPEGGFHPEEIHWARKHDFHLTTLGSLTLRAETAAITGIGIIRHLCALHQNPHT